MIRIHDLPSMECRNPVDSYPIFSPWNMIGEVIFEEVPRLLSSNREHCDQVRWVHSVSQELETNSWCSRHTSSVRLQGKRQPEKKLMFCKDFGRKKITLPAHVERPWIFQSRDGHQGPSIGLCQPPPQGGLTSNDFSRSNSWQARHQEPWWWTLSYHDISKQSNIHSVTRLQCPARVGIESSRSESEK